MTDILIQVVNDHDEPTHGATKEELWRQNLPHRIVKIVIEDETGRILLQRRSPNKIPFPDNWDVSVAGHVDEGEDYEQAALRELSEELGIMDATLTVLGDYRSHSMYEWRRLNRFNRVYKGQINSLTPLVPEVGDIAEVRWVTLAELQNLIKNDPDHVTNGLRETIERYYSPL
ncbi:NUDIX hydrolase [candidate division TM7 genomosp. GTL1]|nr:NUDIX hydrolase [candidate division TM7 genomosp. GTL1]